MLDGTTFIGNFKYLNIQFLFLGKVCIVFDIDLDKPYNKLLLKVSIINIYWH